MTAINLGMFTRVAMSAVFASADRLRMYRQALAFFERMHLDRASLRDIKRAIRVATRIDDDVRIEHYANAAMLRFPKNSVGYLAAAEQLCKRGDFPTAEAVLCRAPRAKQVQSEIAKIRRKLADRRMDRNDPYAALEREVEQVETGQHDCISAEALVTKAKSFLLLNPLSGRAYELLARIYTLILRHDSVIRLLNGMPKKVKPSLRTYMLLSRSFAVQRDHRSALGVLLSAQKKFPQDRRILLQISAMYRDDSQAARAYTFVRAAQAVYPVYGSIRCLTFQGDHGLLEDAEDTLDRIERFTVAERRRFMPMINRVSTFFPHRTAQFAKWRAEVRKFIKATSVDSWEEKVGLAIRLRWIADARALLGKAIGEKTDNETACWLTNIERSLGPMLPLLDIASSNEMGGELLGVSQGVPVRVDPETVDPDKVIEVFIPTAFFVDQEEEKPSYATVREFLLQIYSYLLGRNDLIIVPRQQYNWRYCQRLLRARAVSYHTNAAYDTSWLHVQEAPLAERCSLDHKGFAGYSSLASDYTKIEQCVSDVTAEALAENYRALHDSLVVGNVSKYSQPKLGEAIEGEYVFVAMQIPTDIVAALGRISGVEMVQTVAQAYAGSATKVIVKRHPYCTSMTVQSTLDRLAAEGLIVLSENSVHDLIGGAKAVFTVNSGVGMEALLHMKSVVVTGECDYRYAVAAAPVTVEELRKVIASIPQVNEERVLRFLYFYNTHYAIKKSDPAAIRRALDEWLNNRQEDENDNEGQ